MSAANRFKEFIQGNVRAFTTVSTVLVVFILVSRLAGGTVSLNVEGGLMFFALCLACYVMGRSEGRETSS